MTDVIEQAEHKEAAIFATTQALNDAINLPGGVRPAAAVELARIVGRVLAILAADEQPEDCFATVLTEADGPMGEDGMSDQVIGHFTLQAFGSGDETFGLERKKRLMEIAAILGPDNLESLRRDVAFMIRVEGFN